MRESELLDDVIAGAAPLPPHVLIGPGDDLAALRASDAPMLLGVDQVIDGLHVDAATTPWNLIGGKAIRRCLSDVAAMAGRPHAALVAAAIPTSATREQVNELCRGLQEAAHANKTPIVGGDLSIHRSDSAPLTISVTVLGHIGPQGPISREGALPDDLVVATGHFGGSLELGGGGRHLTAPPRINEALELAALLGDDLHAMIDVSDGLGRDAGRIAVASGLQVTLEASRIPTSPGISVEQALCDGEDYELLAVVSPHATLPSQLGENCPLHVIGRCTNGAGAFIQQTDGSLLPISDMGWDHTT